MTSREVLEKLLAAAKATKDAGVWVALFEACITNGEMKGFASSQHVCDYLLNVTRTTHGAEVWRALIAELRLQCTL